MSKKNYVDYVYGETTALLGNIEKKINNSVKIDFFIMNVLLLLVNTAINIFCMWACFSGRSSILDSAFIIAISVMFFISKMFKYCSFLYADYDCWYVKVIKCKKWFRSYKVEIQFENGYKTTVKASDKFIKGDYAYFCSSRCNFWIRRPYSMLLPIK